MGHYASELRDGLEEFTTKIDDSEVMDLDPQDLAGSFEEAGLVEVYEDEDYLYLQDRLTGYVYRVEKTVPTVHLEANVELVGPPTTNGEIVQVDLTSIVSKVMEDAGYSPIHQGGLVVGWIANELPHYLQAGEEAVVEDDPVNHPSHYTWLPSGVEVIDVTEHLNFNVGNAVKYLIRAGRKDSTTRVQDLQKAQWYLERELQRIELYEL